MVHLTQLCKNCHRFIPSTKTCTAAPTFFCAQPGHPLTRNDVLNLLDVCLLQTDWQNLNILPHSFHQGKASQDMLRGIDVASVRHAGHWNPTSKAFEAYACPDLTAIPPAQIWQSTPSLRHNWLMDRILHLSTCVVETPGSALHHPHHQALAQLHPNPFASLGDWLPSPIPSCHVGSQVSTGQTGS